MALILIAGRARPSKPEFPPPRPYALFSRESWPYARIHMIPEKGIADLNLTRKKFYVIMFKKTIFFTAIPAGIYDPPIIII